LLEPQRRQDHEKRVLDSQTPDIDEKKAWPTCPDGNVRASTTQPMPSANSPSAITQVLTGDRAASMI
jgi:hypothetical protein